MATGPETLVRYLRQLVIRPQRNEASDAVLLGRFIAARDERAFAVLVERHGPLVLHVCQRVLGDLHDAEDAFQATFLVLARKAGTVRPRRAIAAWLHGVAHRVALKSRSARARRLREAQRLGEDPPDPHRDPLAELSVRELLGVVDEEVRRLPRVYRLPVILCCLESRSQEEAAQQLGWTPGSVKGRLERGRVRLHRQLVRRGLTLTALLSAAGVSRGDTSAALIARWLPATLEGALAFGSRETALGGISAGAAALARGMVKTMALAKLKIAAALTLALCLLATGFLIHSAAQSSKTAPEARASFLPSWKPVAAAVSAEKAPVSAREEASVPIEVKGRVLNPEGQPLAGARIYIGYSAHQFGLYSPERQTAYPLRATSGADGRFRFSFARTDLDERWLDDSRPAVIAVAEGYGPDWADVRESGDDAELSLKLVEDLPVNGRILDEHEQPVAGAGVLVWEIRSNSPEELTRFLQGHSTWSDRSWRGGLPGKPPLAITASDGRFQLTGIGRDRVVMLVLEGPAVQGTMLSAVTRVPPAVRARLPIHFATFDYRAPALRSIRGMVRDATGRPVAGVKVSVKNTLHEALTGNDGAYEIHVARPLPGWILTAQPGSGQPYFAATGRLPQELGLDPVSVDFDLMGGIPLSGRITEQTTQKPPRTAVVDYYPLSPNPYTSRLSTLCNMAASSSLVQADGSYSLVVLPGPGAVCVASRPRDWYAVARLDKKDLPSQLHNHMDIGGAQSQQRSGGVAEGMLPVNKYNAIALINPEEQAKSLALDLGLQPARTLRGRVVAPDGKPLCGVTVRGLSAIPDDDVLEGASFAVMGLNPRRMRDLVFLHRDKALGKSLSIRGDEPQPLTVQLEPCGVIIGRMVDKRGKPVPDLIVWLGRKDGSVAAETDRDGRFRAPVLPGQKHWLGLYSQRRLLRQVGEVEVESGRTQDLGDLPLGD
jgi:RNA polymerase sigma factor (sigma-70 family)